MRASFNRDRGDSARADNAGTRWSRGVRAMAWTTPQQVDLARPVPEHIVYVTAMAREDGRVFFYDDIHSHDRPLTRPLARGYPFPR